MSEKPSNPKDAVGIRKVPMSTVPAPVIFEVGLAMLEGARKYGRHNYRAIGVRYSVYYDACMRHLTAAWEGEDFDPDSGLPHLSKAIACLVVLRDSIRRENCQDDRPPKVKEGWMQDLNKMASDIIERYPDFLEAFTEKDMVAIQKTIVPRYHRYDSLHIEAKQPLYESLGPCEFEPVSEENVQKKE